MAQGKSGYVYKRVYDCPIGQRFCDFSCYFWRNGGCEYHTIMAKTRRGKGGPLQNGTELQEEFEVGTMTYKIR